MSVGGENSRVGGCDETASRLHRRGCFEAKTRAGGGVRRNRDSWVFGVGRFTRSPMRVHVYTRPVHGREDISTRFNVSLHTLSSVGDEDGERRLGNPLGSDPQRASERASQPPRALCREPLSAGRAEKNARYKRKNFSLPSDWRLPWQHPGHLGL